jgi:DNA-binding MarR family transcriptional regulator
MIAQRYCLAMGSTPEDRPDLGVLLTLLLDRVIAREQAILEPLDLTMWEYVVMSALLTGPAGSQAELAAAVRRDQTRVIPIIDALEAKGYVRRRPAPHDRRIRTVSLLKAGRDVTGRARTRIRRMEDDLLAALPETRRAQLVRDVQRVLATTTPPED